MKILLIIPHPNPKRSFLSKFQYPCLTLQQIAGITPPEHDVEIVDERYEDIDFNKNYDIVGISVLTYNSLRGYEVARIFREKGIPVVFGGYHASLLPEEAKQHADSVVIGEAEHSWPELLKDVDKGQLKPFYYGRSPTAEEIPPARHDIGVYTLFAEAIQASRGCPTGCEFCSMNIIEGKNFRGRPIDSVIEEMKIIRSKNIFFADASLTISPPFSKQLFKAMKEVNKKFQCFGNINVLTKDDEFLNLAREAGVNKWYVGIESISQENINLSGKGTNKVENYSKAIKKIKDNGMTVCGFFMFGFDFDTPDIFDKTLQAMYDWGLDEASFSIVTPYPGTRLFQRLEKEGRITCYDWSKYAEGNLNLKLNKMSEEELIEGIIRIAFDFYSVKNSLKRSFFYNDFNPINSIMRFISDMSIRSFYKREKFNINRSG
jgi:radical SAM superfamily enzyme YgiQ (UPF0313 family)